jgi:phage shock protein PspC (stress-responsive transcriptional regulator)
MSASVHTLKQSFRQVFPEYANRLDAARSQSEIKKIHQQLIQETQANLAKVLNKSVDDLTATDQTAPIALTQQQYKTLISASGDTIEQQLHVILDGTSRLKSMEQDDSATVTAQIVISGLVALGAVACKAASSELVAGAVETAAAYFGVETATVELVCAISVLVIVAIIIPIIYFMEKPANCIVLLINELDEDLTFLGDYNVHGKPMLMTTPIPQAVVIPGVRTVATAGLIATEKREAALYGTQYGFTFKYKDLDLSFGVECPLTSIYVDNNCWCGIGASAETAAHSTDSANKQSYEASGSGVSLSIRCNSGSGSIAYYIARAYKTPT